MGLRLLITVLCAIGLYVSVFMLSKTKRGERGQLSEPSVVQTARARLFGGVPNALLGTLYYPAFGVAIWLAARPWERFSLLAICVVAALVSVVLAYSLVRITKMPCSYCWTSHIVNWAVALGYGYAVLTGR